MWSMDFHAPFALQLSPLLPSEHTLCSFPFHSSLGSKSWPFGKSKVKVSWFQKGRILAQPLRLSRRPSHVAGGRVWLSAGTRQRCSRLGRGRAHQQVPERLRTPNQDMSMLLSLPFWAAYSTACSSVNSTQIKKTTVKCSFLCFWMGHQR